jgi:hypothetical protein
MGMNMTRGSVRGGERGRGEGGMGVGQRMSIKGREKYRTHEANEERKAHHRQGTGKEAGDKQRWSRDKMERTRKDADLKYTAK